MLHFKIYSDIITFNGFITEIFICVVKKECKLKSMVR